ncbi:hypothetical protein BT93_E2423 [Corymbia citriodora subsp. variegata]|nr:hypothetical protein BT93_E2423 [Corymbia citriodora subsp. variegata]
MGNSPEEMMQQIANAVQKLTETVELANGHSPHLGRECRVDARSTGVNDVRNLRLQFQTKLSDLLFTGRKLRGVGVDRISIALIDANTGKVVTSGPESSIKLDVVVLEGDFNKDDEDDWTHEEFENFVVKERRQKGLLLMGDLQVTLNGGVGELGELIFTDNSSWNRSKRFRIGIKKALGYCGNMRIREAKTDAFRVKEHRGESSVKHDIPALDDEIWRLKMIAKDGKYHQRLSEAGIHKVGDFLLQLFTDPMKLKKILGMSSNSTNWDTLENHAKSCKINRKLYLYYTDGVRKHGAVFNTNHQLIGLIKDRVYCAIDRLSTNDLEHGDTVVKKALDNWDDVREFNGETFSMQKKSSGSFPCHVFERQIENLIPIPSDLPPPICAAPGGPQAPLANVDLTAEGHNDATALALPVQSPNANPGNGEEFLVDEFPIEYDPTFGDIMNGLNFPGVNSITNVRSLTQNQDINFQFSMTSHLGNCWWPMDSIVDGLPYASTSSFQSRSALLLPAGIHGMEDFRSPDSDDSTANGLAASEKHEIPAFDDEIWRLKMIAKDGRYHQKLSEAGIHKVGDFLMQLFTDPMKLKEILGMSSNSTNWDTLENQAKRCKINWKLYWYYTESMRKHGVVFNIDHQLFGLIKDGLYSAADRLSADDLEHGHTIVKKALDNKNDVMEFNGETFSPSMQKKSSSLLTPQICAAPGGLEAPLPNVGLTAEGHNGTTALTSPVQLQNTNSGTAMKLSVDESVRVTAPLPISTDPSNILITRGDNGIPTGGSPIQSHGNNFHNATWSHTIYSSSQMHHTVNENAPPSELPSAMISRSQSSSTLPPSEGYLVMGNFSDDKDNWWENLLSHSSTDYDEFLKTPLYDGGSVRGTSRGVIGWLKIKAVMQWGIFIRKTVMKRRGIIVQPPIELQTAIKLLLRTQTPLRHDAKFHRYSPFIQTIALILMLNYQSVTTEKEGQARAHTYDGDRNGDKTTRPNLVRRLESVEDKVRSPRRRDRSAADGDASSGE